MTHTFVSLTNRKWQEKKCRGSFHEACSSGTVYLHIRGPMSLTPLAVKDRRGRGVYAKSQSHIFLNMQSHSRGATVTPLLLNMQSHILLNIQSDCYPIWLNMHSTPRLINMQSRSREATVAQAILLNMQTHSRVATVMSRRRGVTASLK